MSKTSFSESWSNFLSYVKLFLFVAVVGGVGYYFYTNRTKPVAAEVAEPGETENTFQSPDPAINEPKTPSGLLRPIMSAAVPKILAPLSEGPYEFEADFLALEVTLENEVAGQGTPTSPWRAAQKLYQEIKRIGHERNTAIEAFKKDETLVDASLRQNVSPNQLRELQTRKEFFLRNKQKKWETTLPQMRSSLQFHYEQILILEKNSP